MSAKGTVSGSDSRIVIGCSHDSNCAASTRYMKMNERPDGDGEAPDRASGLLGQARRRTAW